VPSGSAPATPLSQPLGQQPAHCSALALTVRFLPSLLQAPRWGTCGGITSHGTNTSSPDVCCPTSTVCQHYNQYFWRCQPLGYVQPPEPRYTWDLACTGAKVGSGTPHDTC
jgi:hypothetical protein